MRNSTSCSTPKINATEDDKISDTVEKGSAKKLKQARLPFKIIAPGTSSLGLKTITMSKCEDTENRSTDVRKRKLSYESDGDGINIIVKKDDNVVSKNVDILTSGSKKQKLTAASKNHAVLDCVVSLLDEGADTDEEGNTENVANSSLTIGTPKGSGKDKRKGAGTPHKSNVQKDKNGSATKLQIKLPLSAGKKKHRKSILHTNSPTENFINNLTQEISSDDIEEIAAELNPHKRQKLNNDYDKTSKTKTTIIQQQEIETIALDSESEEDHEKKSFETEKSSEILKEATSNLLEKSCENDDAKNVQDSSDDEEKQKDEEDMDDSVLSDNDNEADDETDNLAGKTVSVSSDANNKTKSKFEDTKQLLTDKKNSITSSKNLTPKQLKLMDQRRRAREEKERKLQEGKLKKQQEKEEKEIVRKREREEKEEQKRKEREEKDEQKRKEREEKERKRLAEIEAKNEEKKKKNEAKEEELRKKEEERKRKEQEKEEAELKKKKAAQAFTKFFVAKTSNQLKNEEENNTGDRNKILAFRPFQIKGDMKLAPICRKYLTADQKAHLEDLLKSNKNKIDVKENVENDELLSKPQLYLSELRAGKILPGKWRRPSTESKDDVIFVEDELERVGQAIVEDIPAYVREEMRVKFYKFHDNRRPPYYGTWRKKSLVVKPKRPFAQDRKIFDYEIDSDDEWEEEEPGESLEDGSDEDKEKESEDDEYEVDNEWFVPHGHLSDEELQNEDEFGNGDDNTREAQKAKLKILQQEFAQEMKKKTEKIKPRLIGCIWANRNGNQPSNCANILWDTLEKKAMLFVDTPLIEEPEADRSTEPNSPSGATNGNTEKATEKLKPISLSDNMIKDLTRLIHGNNHAKNFLINEYIAYVEKTEESVKNGGWRKPLKSVVRDKIDEIAEWQAVDATASSIQEIEQTHGETNDKKKKKVKRRLCWVVKQEMLDKMDMSSLKLKNAWKYTLPPKLLKTDKTTRDETATTLKSENMLNSAVEAVKGKNSETSQITKYTKVLTNEKMTTKQQNTPLAAKINSYDKTVNETKLENAPFISKEKKRVPLLMSVARGQQISTPAKNKLISQFLQQQNKDSMRPNSPTKTSIKRSNAIISPNVENDDDDVVILD